MAKRTKGPRDRGVEARNKMRRVLADWQSEAATDERFKIHPQAIETIAGMVESHVWFAVLNDRAARARKARE